MNQEEFKLCIMKQFKAADSPIRALMLADKKNYSFSHCLPYLNVENFFASEFSLRFKVEQIYPRSKDGVAFHVSFHDLDATFHPSLISEVSDMSQDSRFALPIFTEVIRFKGNLIEFWMEAHTLQQAGYEFSFQNQRAQCVAVYDVATGCFMDGTTKEAACGAIEQFVQSSQVGYVRYQLDTTRLTELKNTLHSIDLDAEWQKKVYDAYMKGFRVMEVNTPLSAVIASLFNLGPHDRALAIA